MTVFHWDTLYGPNIICQKLMTNRKVKAVEIQYLPNIRSLWHCDNRLRGCRVFLKSHLSHSSSDD